MKDTDPHVCIMKLASGPLSGNELMLKVDSHQIIAGPGYDYHTDTDDQGFTTYYLPSEQGYYELAIVSGPVEKSGVATHTNRLFLRLGGDLTKSKQPIIFQEMMLADSFPLLIKAINTPWRTPPSSSASSPLAEEADEAADTTNSTVRPQRKLIYLAVVALVLAATFIGWLAWNDNAEVRKVKNLEALLQGSSSPLTVTTGENGRSLVLVQTQRDIDWSTQRLLREHYAEPVMIKKISVLENEIEEQLGKILPGLLKVDLSQPCQPIIRRLQGDTPQPDNTLVQQTLTRFLTCHPQSIIENYTSAELLRKAEQGLAESNVPWRVVNKNTTPIFIINASLNDKQTISAIDFAEKFTKKWGERHIQFSISLVTNHLAGKSFINNPNGYVLLDNNHWYFNPISF